MPSGGIFECGPCRLHVRSRQLISQGSAVALSARQFEVSHALVAAAGVVVSKDRLVEAAWHGVVVGDSAIEKEIVRERIQRIDGTGDRVDYLSALDRAVLLEPDNWLHLFRQSLGHWGDARYRAARRVLAQYPHFPMAHLLVATVKVARGTRDDAEREIDAAMAHAALLVARGSIPAAARLLADALAAAPPGNAGWTIPIDPLLDVQHDPGAWAGVLQLLRDRAA